MECSREGLLEPKGKVEGRSLWVGEEQGRKLVCWGIKPAALAFPVKGEGRNRAGLRRIKA